jgi:hypothetical protein
MSCANIPNLTSFSAETSQRQKINDDNISDAINLPMLRREKQKKMIFEENRLDPQMTFTSLMDFDFFSQIRQPWRKCRDVDINFIV